MHCELLEFAVFAQDIVCIGGLVAPYSPYQAPKRWRASGLFPWRCLLVVDYTG